MVSLSGISGGGRGRVGSKLLKIVKNAELLKKTDFNGEVKSQAVSFADRVYLIREHHTALVHWARALRDGRINYDSVILHIDYHPDLGEPHWVDELCYQNPFYSHDSPDFRPPEYYKLSPEDLLFKKAERITRQIDSHPDLLPEECFIFPAIKLGIIGEYVHIIPGDKPKFAYEREISISDKTLTLDGFLESERYNPKKTYIFDLDLDFFSDLKVIAYTRQANLNEDLEKILKILRMFKPGVVTIAFSPFSADMERNYLTLKLEECSEVIARILVEMDLDVNKVKYYDEPRRYGRCSST